MVVAHLNLHNLMSFFRQNESLIIPTLSTNQIENQKLRTFPTGTCLNNRNFDGFSQQNESLVMPNLLINQMENQKLLSDIRWWINLAIFYCMICTVICR